VLASPARVRIVWYLKGGGPRIVTVETGVSSKAGDVIENSEGILPLAAQRWRIYATNRQMPYRTSVCSGSEPEGAHA
jgi:hypothetical protein